MPSSNVFLGTDFESSVCHTASRCDAIRVRESFGLVLHYYSGRDSVLPIASARTSAASTI
jgi:hypothetical protein